MLELVADNTRKLSLFERAFEGHDILVFSFNDELYFKGKDIATILEYANPKQAINTHCKNQISAKKLFKNYYNNLTWNDYKNNKVIHPQTLFIKQDEVLNLIYKSNSSSDEYKLKFVNWLKHNKLITKDFNFILSSREEIQFFDKLQLYLNNIFKLKIQTQFSIGSYFIDGYITELKLAIEFDENGHKHYDQNNEKFRQIFIENLLNCEFIRLTNKDSIDYNISQVILKINNMVYSKNEI